MFSFVAYALIVSQQKNMNSTINNFLRQMYIADDDEKFEILN